MLQQMLYRPNSSENLARSPGGFGPGGQRSLTGFAVFVITPDDAVSQFPVFANQGLVCQGFLRGRTDDFAALGLTLGGVSSRLQDQQ
jgi:hypothetical protein